MTGKVSSKTKLAVTTWSAESRVQAGRQAGRQSGLSFQ